MYGTDIEASGDREGAWAYLVSLASGDESLAEDYLHGRCAVAYGDTTRWSDLVCGRWGEWQERFAECFVYDVWGVFLSLTLAAIEDGRAISALNGKLGNIVREE